MKSVVALLLIIGCGYAYADVYKWTDAHGEVHFSETPPSSVKPETVMTQKQIQQIENSDQAASPPPPPSDETTTDQELQRRLSECQRFKSMRDAYLINTDQTEQYRVNSMVMGTGYPLAPYGLSNGNSSDIASFSDIEAGIRQNCQD